jgi:hypothetical protein
MYVSKLCDRFSNILYYYRQLVNSMRSFHSWSQVLGCSQSFEKALLQCTGLYGKNNLLRMRLAEDADNSSFYSFLSRLSHQQHR